MNLKQTHPEYQKFIKKWQFLDDSFQKNIKDQGFEYLKPTPGMRQDGLMEGQIGQTRYLEYLDRATYPDYLKDSILATLGLMHNKLAQFELPNALESVLSQEYLQEVIYKITALQLLHGRVGIFLDYDNEKKPKITIYNAKSILNWNVDENNKLNYCVLNESGYVLNDEYIWEEVDEFIVCAVIDGKYYYTKTNQENISADELEEFLVKQKNVDQIPFVLINSVDCECEIDLPVFYGLAETCLTIYREDADFRQYLFNCTQDTLVVYTDNDLQDIRLGVGAHLKLGSQDKAEFIGVDAGALAEKRNVLNDDHMRAQQQGIRLIKESNSKESGEALALRTASQTASLPRLAQTATRGLENLLKVYAEFEKITGDIKVIPNLDFSNAEFDAAKLKSLMDSKLAGAPLSMESIHNYVRRTNGTTFDYDEEKIKIETESNGENLD